MYRLKVNKVNFSEKITHRYLDVHLYTFFSCGSRGCMHMRRGVGVDASQSRVIARVLPVDVPLPLRWPSSATKPK